MNKEFGLSQQAFINWKKIGLYVLVAALVAGLLVSKLGTKKTRAEEDYVSAATAFTKWEQALDESEDSFVKLNKLVKKHPELQAHYDASIAQSLLATISRKEAIPFIERTLQRTHQPYYSDYAQISLKVSEGRYQEALDDSLHLKNRLDTDPSFKNKSALFAFNLMRIATLSKELNHKKLELEAWKEIKQHGSWDKEQRQKNFIGHEGFKQLSSHFSVQEATLLDYIGAREEALRNP